METEYKPGWPLVYLPQGEPFVVAALLYMNVEHEWAVFKRPNSERHIHHSKGSVESNQQLSPLMEQIGRFYSPCSVPEPVVLHGVDFVTQEIFI